MRNVALTTWVLAAAGARLAGAGQVGEFPAALKGEIQNVVILYTENRSFDSVYGSYPNARGLADAKPAQYVQTDAMGHVLPCLPQAYLSDTTDADTRFPPAATKDRHGNALGDLAAPAPHQNSVRNGYFDADRFAALDSVSGDMVHRFYTEQYQINRIPDPKNAGGSPMSKYVTWSNNPALVMGEYDVQDLGEGRLAKEFVLCDNVFHSAFGGSFLNHFWLVAARTPVWPAFPGRKGGPGSSVKATEFDENGYPKFKDGKVVDDALTNDPRLPPFEMSNVFTHLGDGDYWAVNTREPLQGPADDPVETRLPPQEFDTIGDRMTAGGVTWAWYSGGWDDAKAGRADPLFQYHHQPFAYFKRYALAKAPIEGTGSAPGVDSPNSARFLKDETEFGVSLKNGTLPQVSFVKPLGEWSGHPGQSSIVSEQEWVADTVAKIRSSPYWGHVAIFIIPDENGGLWDHVPPPQIDAWGPGTRVPMIIVSPFAKRAVVDHTQYETVSIIRFIELRWGLPALNERDAHAQAPTEAFGPTS